MNKKIILVTGGLGYIGSHIVFNLLKNNYPVIVVDQNENRKLKILNILGNFKNFSFFSLDISKISINKILIDKNVDSIIHCAGKKSFIDSWKEPDLYIKKNLDITKNLLSSLTPKVKELIFISSGIIYENTVGNIYKEDDLVDPKNPYAKSKYLQEKILKEFSLNNNVKVSVLRCFNLVGGYYEYGLGEDVNQVNSVNAAIVKTIHKHDEFSIYGNDLNTFDNTTVRDYIHIDDLVSAIKLCLELEKYQHNFQLFNIGSGKGTSIKQLLNIFESMIDKKIPVKYLEKREGESASFIANIDKAKSVLGWIPKKSIEVACEDILKANFII